MSAVWQITRWDSDSKAHEWKLPSNLSESEVQTILQRLVCQNLSDAEIIGSSLRRGSPGRLTLLDRIGTGSPLTVGENPHYTALRHG